MSETCELCRDKIVVTVASPSVEPFQLGETTGQQNTQTSPQLGSAVNPGLLAIPQLSIEGGFNATDHLSPRQVVGRIDDLILVQPDLINLLVSCGIVKASSLPANVEQPVKICGSCFRKTGQNVDVEFEKSQMATDKLKNQLEKVESDIKRTETKIQGYAACDDAKLQEELRRIEIEEKKQREQLSLLVEKQLALEKDEKEFWREINTYERQMLMLEEKNSCADHYLAFLKKETQRLSRYNVLNEVFQLSSEEENGLVNSLRIGYIKELQGVKPMNVPPYVIGLLG